MDSASVAGAAAGGGGGGGGGATVVVGGVVDVGGTGAVVGDTVDGATVVDGAGGNVDGGVTTTTVVGAGAPGVRGTSLVVVVMVSVAVAVPVPRAPPAAVVTETVRGRRSVGFGSAAGECGVGTGVVSGESDAGVDAGRLVDCRAGEAIANGGAASPNGPAAACRSVCVAEPQPASNTTTTQVRPPTRQVGRGRMVFRMWCASLPAEARYHTMSSASTTAGGRGSAFRGDQ